VSLQKEGKEDKKRNASRTSEDLGNPQTIKGRETAKAVGEANKKRKLGDRLKGERREGGNGGVEFVARAKKECPQQGAIF